MNIISIDFRSTNEISFGLRATFIWKNEVVRQDESL